MKRLWYASGHFDTGDTIAEAVMEYAAALAVHSQAVVVHVPVEVDGEASVFDIVLGPSTQLVAEPAPFLAPEVEDHVFVASVREAITKLR
jgi:hypothetical protein